MRTFDSGATRDDNIHKLNYVRGLSAQVQQRYLEYLGSHRLQKDGSLRDWDNWKKGIDPAAYRESLSRHTQDAVRASMGLPVPEDASLEDLLCAIIFNANGWLFELLVAKSGNRESACLPITDLAQLLPAGVTGLDNFLCNACARNGLDCTPTGDFGDHICFRPKPAEAESLKADAPKFERPEFCGDCGNFSVLGGTCVIAKHRSSCYRALDNTLECRDATPRKDGA